MSDVWSLYMDKKVWPCELRGQVEDLDRSTLLELQHVVEMELEERGEETPYQAPDTGTLIGQGVYIIGEHIPAGTYSFYLPQYISGDASSSTHLFIFENLEKYHEHLKENEGGMGIFPHMSVYRDAPVSCVTLTAGQILVIYYNGAIISKFTLEI